MTNRRRKRWGGPPLAWRNLVQTKARLLVGVAAISFAAALVFMQLGFQGAVEGAALLLYEVLDFDIVMISPKSAEATYAQPFPRRHLYQAEGVPGVATAEPFYASFRQWRNAETTINRPIFIAGFNYRDAVFRVPEVYQHLKDLQRQDTVLFNRLSRVDFGPRAVGLKTELGERQIEIVGLFSLNNTLRADGFVIVSDQNFARLFPGRSLDTLNLGLIKVEPGTDVDTVVQRLRKVIPPTIDILSRQEAKSKARDYWINFTSIGFVVSVGVVMAILVGTVIIYQVLNADVVDHLNEYATLKAIGYSNQRLLSLVLQEAVILAVIGYIPGFILALGIYQAAFQATSLPFSMTLSRAVLVFGLMILTCCASGFVAARKALVADPADVF